MRQIVLDTETTGLDPALGHRIIEIGGVELINRRTTGRHFHRYLNPGRDSEDAALQVHGLSADFLRDKPKFDEVAAEFLEFVEGAELVIHNAAFDVAFLDAELALAGRRPLAAGCAGIVDTLRMAKDIHPGKKNTLDALCERYQIDNSARTLHGALLDAQLLAEVYLAMTRGQESFAMELETLPAALIIPAASLAPLELLLLPASDEELAAHRVLLAEIDKSSGGACVWMRLAE